MSNPSDPKELEKQRWRDAGFTDSRPVPPSGSTEPTASESTKPCKHGIYPNEWGNRNCRSCNIEAQPPASTSTQTAEHTECKRKLQAHIDNYSYLLAQKDREIGLLTQERDEALDLIRKLFTRQAIQPASQLQWVERWLKERGISWRQG